MFDNCDLDKVKIQMFGQTLSPDIYIWYKSFCAEAPRTWLDITAKFLSKYYSESKAHRMRGTIICYKNYPDENLYAGYLRFKSYIDDCPHHGLPEWLITHTFYGGLNEKNRLELDSVSNGSFLSYTYDEAWNLIIDIQENYESHRDVERIT